MLCLLLFVVAINAAAQVDVEPGVSRQLAQYRAQNVRDVTYDLSFVLPAEKQEEVGFQEEIGFEWGGDGDLQLDFQGRLLFAHINDAQLDSSCYRDEHIVIPARCLQKGRNLIRIGGKCSDKSLNRQADYLYTLFVPDHARSAFACFDQPDIKGRYTLSLVMPADWTASSNGLQQANTEAEGQRSMTFQTTRPLPTYLFSFTAGRFSEQKTTRNGRELTALYRETDPQKVAQLPIIFDEIALSLRWMEQYTGIAYPFQKYGFVILPGYQFGGMEHPGCIQYKDQTLFLGPNPTPDEELNRLHLLAHETAHMWFGDLVTMRWFDDVWTKEVFANFMADKIAEEQYPELNHELSFIRTHYIPAIATDRTLGTHPIQQPLDNLNQAGLLYGNIIYHKAPIMMRKLEEQMGEEGFQRGLQKYLSKFAYANATWDELIDILDQEAPDASLRDFDRLWVKQKGIPTEPLNVYADELPNFDGMDYVRYVLDDSKAADEYIGRWDELQALTGLLAAAMTLHDNYLAQRATAQQTFQAIYKMSQEENSELLLSACGNMLVNVMTSYPRQHRAAIEQQLWHMATTHPVKAFRQQLLRSMGQTVTSKAIVDSIYDIWKSHNHPLLNTRNYMAMAYHLAIVRPDQWQEIVGTQRSRIANADLQREFDFVSRACTPHQAEQDQLFQSLLQRENRAVEPYALAMLALLNDPAREPYNNKYITPGLQILEEIQRTGDIFFPLNWCQSLLGGHQSREAAQLVRSFLDHHPHYPVPLRNKLLQAAYVLMARHGMNGV